MTQWSFDILGQTGFDWWLLVCVAACVVLIVYALANRLWSTPRGWAVLPLIILAVAGTVAILAVPFLHRPLVGMLWTFAVLSLLSVTFYLNLIPQLGYARMAVLLLIRIPALALIVLMLFEPVVSYVHRPQPERPLLFLIDVSGSMSFPDVPNGPTRIQSVWQTLRPELSRINDHFVPQFATFATDWSLLKTPDALAAIQADGKSTDILKGLNQTLAQTTRSDAQIILLSDGIDNTSGDGAVLAAARRSGHPIHTLIVGSDQAEPASMPNIAVDNIEGADDFIVGHESKLKAIIKSTALANRVVDVKMAEVDADGKYIGQTTSQKLVLQPVPQGQSVELTYKPAAAGIHRLAVWVDPIPGERSTIDNRQEFQGLALDPRIKVLYIEGSARPEYRSLTRAMASDQNVEIATLLRIQQDRFTAGGRVDGEPFTHFPSRPEEWQKFDVIILGDLDSTFLTRAQQEAIEQTCANGAGLLMIGGQKNFGPGNYKDMPIEKCLPVFVGEAKMPQETDPFIPRLTAEGLTHPAMEGLSDWFGSADKPPTKELPKLTGNVVVAKAKSGAQILLIHPGRAGPDGKPEIVLASEYYGKGRSMAFTADTTWRWFLPMAGAGQESPYKRFWGQIVRWLAGADVRNRQHGAGVEGLLNKSLYQLGENVRIRAMVRDAKGDATEYATVNLKLTQPGQEPRQFPLHPVESRRGMYDVTLPNPEKGDWVAELIASKDGHELGRQKLKFTVIPPAEEMYQLVANTGLMTDLARQTGGFAYRLDQLPTLLDELIKSDPAAAVARAETVPLANTIRAAMAFTGHPPVWPHKWDLPMQGLLVVVLLAGEWLLRRYWQLP